MNFSVWAPFAQSVDLVISSQRHAMSKAADGLWSVEVSSEAAAGGYKYSLDGGEPLPDPRSRWQPEGVHGNSYRVDAEELRGIWRSDFRAKALADAVIYELHVGTFSPEGTYAGARRKLDHLVSLGVTHIELLPIATFPGAHGWGYDGVYLYAPLPAYGTPRELAEFVRDCHARGLAVLLDVVYNHLGPDGNYLGAYGPYFTDRVKTGWGQAVNYDGPHSDEVRRFVTDNARMWLGEYGFDGLRLDAVHAIFSFEAVHLLEDVAKAVKELERETGRDLVLIAESDLNDPRLVMNTARGGFGLTAHWSDDFHHALHRFFTGETSGYYEDFHGIEDIATAFKDGYVYQGQYSVHRKRRHGRSPRGLAPHQLVVSAQNHDQIGNRARGDRLSVTLSVPQLKAVAALTLLSPFVPMLFQGEEWGASTPFQYFTDHQDAELGRLVSEGRAREFSAFNWQGDVPDPQAHETFERSKLDWSELDRPPHAELLRWHRDCMALRVATRSSTEGRKRPRVKFDKRGEWLSIEYGALALLFNFGDRPHSFQSDVNVWHVALDSSAEGVDAAEPTAGDPVAAHATRVLRRSG